MAHVFIQMTRPTYKELLTQTVLDTLEEKHWTFEEALKRWWFNPRRDGGLRLTQVGDLEFRYAKIEFFTHDFKTDTKVSKSYYNLVLELDKKIKCPYYMDVDSTSKKPYIRLYDSRISMMLALYGDIDSYLNSIKVKR